MRTATITLIAFLFFSVELLAQVEWTTYKAKNSLHANYPYEVFVDSKNRIWVCDASSNGGASFYDGEKWTNLSKNDGLADDIVYGIAEDSKGNLWFATANGASKFDGSGFTNYTTTHGLKNNSLREVAVDKSDNIWLGGLHGLNKLTSTGIWVDHTDSLIFEAIRVVFPDKENKIWIGTYSGVSLLNAGAWKHYSAADGLVDNHVKSICQDSLGNYWFGTSGGVSKFDGTNWTTYNKDSGLVNNDIQNIHLDAEGNLWFASYTLPGGLTKYNGTNWISYQDEHGLLTNYVSDVVTDTAGNVWIGTGFGINRMAAASFKSIPGTSAKAFLAHDDEVWAATALGVNVITANKTVQPDFADSTDYRSIYSFAKDSTGNVWIGTLTGVYKYNGNNFFYFNQDSGLADNFAGGIEVDKNNHVYFAGRYGLTKFDGHTWITFGIDEGMHNETLYSSHTDKDGNIWLGSFELAIKFTGTQFFNYSNPLLKGSILDIYMDDANTAWFASDSGLVYFDGSNWGSFTTSDGLPSNRILTVQADKTGKLWIGTEGNKITAYDGQDFYTYTLEGINVEFVYQILDYKDELWIGTNQGIYIHEYSDFFTAYKSGGLPADSIKCIYSDSKSNIWVGTEKYGASMFDGLNWTAYDTTGLLFNMSVVGIQEDNNGDIWILQPDALTRLRDTLTISYYSGGLPFSTFSGITKDKEGNLWFATNKGVAKYNGSSFTEYKTGNGLPNNNVKAVYVASSGKVWAATIGGVAVFDGMEWTAYTTDNGLVNNWVTDLAEDKEGNIWFATQSGVARWNGIEFTNFGPAQGFGSYCLSMSTDSFGNIWAGTWGNGVVRFMGNNRIIYRTTNGLANNEVQDITCDNNGTLWFATYGGITSLKRPVFSATVDYTPLNCYGQNDGHISLSSTMEELNYSVNGDSFGAEPSFSTLQAGYYTPMVANVFDTIKFEVILTEPDEILVDLGKDSLINITGSIVLQAPADYASYLWSTGETTNNILIKGDEKGEGIFTYSVVVTDSSGCKGSDTIRITIFDPDHIVNENIDEYSTQWVKVFPNPCKDILEISLNRPGHIYEIALYSVEGKLVYLTKNEMVNPTLNLSGYANGIYLLKLSLQNGEKINTTIVVAR